MKRYAIYTIFFISLAACAELNLQDIEVPDLDDFAVIKEKCDQLGGNGTYEALKASKNVIQTCVQDFADFNVIKNEVEEAKKTGSMDEVFGKYCAKRSKLGSCLQGFIDNLEKCLDAEQKTALNMTLDIIKQLGSFVCFRDGDRIAMFVAEGGVECIKDHTEGIKTCVNNTLKIDTQIKTDSLPSFLLDKKKCDDLGKLQTCVVEELEKCKDSTPANIVDALFRYIKRSACGTKTKRHTHNLMKRSLHFVKEMYNSSASTLNFMSYFHEKCEINAPKGAYKDLTTAVTDVMTCLQENAKPRFKYTASPEDLKEVLRTCTEDVIRKVEVCLPENEKYWPHFILNITYSIVDFIHANKNKLNANSLQVEFINCFQNMKHKNVADEVNQCFTPKDVDKYNLDREVFCKRMSALRNCLKEQFNKNCIRDVTINQLQVDFFKALLENCQETKN